MGDTAAALAGKRILVIEDEMLLALELFDELEAAGATPVGPIGSVPRALALLGEGPACDAALLNVHLRGELSFPIAEQLAAAQVPFLFLTGNDDFVREHFPGVPRQPKPWDVPKLVEALALLCSPQEQSRSQAAAR